ncbi:MAG: hypothetical protein ABSE73_24705, partial [Planctomycetota bacterium]
MCSQQVSFSTVSRVVMRRIVLLCLVPVLHLAGGEPAPSERIYDPSLPRVPAQATIVKGSPSDEAAAIREWSKSFIELKEKKALLELKKIKEEVKTEEAIRAKEEEEARQRQRRYDESLGTLRPVAPTERHGPLHVRLEFMVPEIQTYRLAAEVSRARQALANDVVALLGRLDRNGDGKLTDDEYRDAGALLSATTSLFAPLDSTGDGYLTAEKLEAVRNLPENAAAALRLGRVAASAKDFRIKPFDTK